MSGRPWYEEFFDDFYLQSTGLTDSRTQAEVDVLTTVIESCPPGDVLDLACGQGRHAVRLAERGYNVIGLDRNGEMLRRASLLTTTSRSRIHLLRADMRLLPLRAGTMSCVLNYFSSFGYFELEAEDEDVVREVGRVLRGGGRFVLEFINVYESARRHSRRSWYEDDDGTRVLSELTWDVLSGRLTDRRSYVRSNASEILRVSVMRAYSARELASLFRRAGLSVEGLIDPVTGKDITILSPRFAIIGRKP
jgi:SAM-dependent methyltransferase